MYFWFAIVAASSLLDNLAGVPFSHQWTIRVSRAPNIQIDEDAPWVIPEIPELNGYAISGPKMTISQSERDQISISIADQPSNPSINIPRKPVPRTLPTVPPPVQECMDTLTGLERGYNTVGGIVIDRSKSWSASNDGFYVILSVKTMSYAHAFLRIFSKLMSIGVFAIGTC